MSGMWSEARARLLSKRGSAVIAVVSLGAAVGITGFMVLPGATATPSGKVTICHRTSATTNPYITETINTSSVDEVNNSYLNGHGDHTGPVFDPENPQTSWGDIIPPFQDDTSGTIFPGQNWSTAGQAIWANGCAIASQSSSASSSGSESSSSSESSSESTSSITTPASETSASESGSSSAATSSGSASVSSAISPSAATGSGSSDTSAQSGSLTSSAAAGVTSAIPPTGVNAGGGATANSGQKPWWIWLIAAFAAFTGFAAVSRFAASGGRHR